VDKLQILSKLLTLSSSPVCFHPVIFNHLFAPIFYHPPFSTHLFQALPRLHCSSAADDKRIVSYLHIQLFSNVLHRRCRISPRRPMYLLIVGSHYCAMRFAYALHMCQQNFVPLPYLYIEFFELVVEVIFHYCTTPPCHQIER